MKDTLEMKFFLPPEYPSKDGFTVLIRDVNTYGNVKFM